jgi:hypothetical protein
VYDVQVVIQGVGSASADQLEGFAERLRTLLGALDPAIVFWPRDNELGAQFQLEEEVLDQLLQPVESSLAA